MTIHGEHGALRFTGEEVLLSRDRSPFAASPERISPAGQATLTAERSERGRCDRAALAPAATFADGLMQQRVLDAARKSSAEGGLWVAV